MNAFALTLILKSSLLIGAAAFADFLMRRRTSAASRHLMWTLALSGVLVLPVLAMVVPSWGIPIRAASPAVGPDESPASPSAASLEADITEPSDDAAAAKGGVASTAAGLAIPAPRVVSGPGLVLALYLAGVSALGLRLAIGRWSLRRLVLRSSEVKDPAWQGLLRECGSMIGWSHDVRLLRSLDRNMPMAFGVLRPTILIPAIADTWSEDRRRAVLLHELAHIDRRDCFTQLLAELCCAAYWMHPGVWWGARRLRVERELACDDRVLTAGEPARDYASHLLELAYSLGGSSSPALAVSMARPRQLEGRLLAVLDAARNRVSPPRLAPVIGLVVTTALLVPLAAAEAVVIPASSAAAPALVEWSEPAAANTVRDESEPAPAPQPSAGALASPSPVAAEKRTERRREIRLPGTWEVRLSEDGKTLHVQLSDRPNSNHGFTTPLDQFEGLPASLLTGSGGAAKFSLRRDAGTLEFDGVFRTGVGAGTFDFTPSPTFPAEMVKRGFASPSALDQYELARGNIGFAYLDELNAQKYERPTLDDLVQAANHGVHLDYLRGMGEAGYHLGRIDALIRTRDHGVTPAYIRALSAEGFSHLPAEDLVRARDHGVTAEYVGAMRAFGYKGLTLDELLRARDHGVSADYIRSMAELGHQGVPLAQLVRARDHGVTADYIKALREAGYGVLSFDELVNARDHGVSADFVREMASLGPERPSLSELARARDHGVSAEFARAWRDAGYPPMLADMTQAREHGVSADFIGSLKALGYDRLSVEDLIRLRDHGVSAGFVRDRNAEARSRLSVEELVRLREGRGESRRR